MNKYLEKQNDYYNKKTVQKKIAYHCRYREVIIIKQLPDRKMTLRPFKVFKPEHFRWLYHRLHLDQVKFDLYISNASVKLPPLPSKLEELKRMRENLKKTWMDRITGWDFFVDLDAENKEDEPKLLEYAKIIKNNMSTKQDYPVNIYKTGSGGVHLVQKGKFTPDFVKNEVMDIACKHSIPMSYPVKTKDGQRFIADNGKWRLMKPEEETPSPDGCHIDNTVYDFRRIRRVPFSLHSKTGKPMTKVV